MFNIYIIYTKSKLLCNCIAIVKFFLVRIINAYTVKGLSIINILPAAVPAQRRKKVARQDTMQYYIIASARSTSTSLLTFSRMTQRQPSSSSPFLFSPLPFPNVWKGLFADVARARTSYNLFACTTPQ